MAGGSRGEGERVRRGPGQQSLADGAAASGQRGPRAATACWHGSGCGRGRSKAGASRAAADLQARDLIICAERGGTGDDRCEVGRVAGQHPLRATVVGVLRAIEACGQQGGTRGVGQCAGAGHTECCHLHRHLPHGRRPPGRRAQMHDATLPRTLYIATLQSGFTLMLDIRLQEGRRAGGQRARSANASSGSIGGPCAAVTGRALPPQQAPPHRRPSCMSPSHLTSRSSLVREVGQGSVHHVRVAHSLAGRWNRQHRGVRRAIEGGEGIDAGVVGLRARAGRRVRQLRLQRR